LLVVYDKEGHFRCAPSDSFYFEGKANTKLNQKERMVERISAKIEVAKIEKTKTEPSGWEGRKAILLRHLFFIREHFSERIERLMRESESAFALGLVFGKNSKLSFEFKEQLSKTGTNHLIALSGFNISIFIFAFFDTLKYLSPVFAFFTTSFFIAAFVLMTGASASITRAAIMGTMLIAGRVLGRQIDNVYLLCFTLFLVTLWSPYGLLWDIGLQFSFLAFCGLIYLSPIIKEKMKFLGFLGEGFADTLGAIIFVLPLNAYYFQNISIIAPVVNVLVIAVIPLISYLIILAGLVDLFSHFLAGVFSYIAQIFLDYCLGIIGFFSQIHWAGFKIYRFNFVWILVYYFIIFGILRYLWFKKMKYEAAEI